MDHQENMFLSNAQYLDLMDQLDTSIGDAFFCTFYLVSQSKVLCACTLSINSLKQSI